MPALRVTLALLGLIVAVPGAAQTLVTVTGRQVPARADAETVAPTTSARSHYAVHCAGCHGMDGAGSRLGYVPALRQLGQFLPLEGGREYVIKVPGVMGSGLSDQQVAEVTNWVLQTMAAASLPAGFAPYTREEVTRARSTPLIDVLAARQRLAAQARERGLALYEP